MVNFHERTIHDDEELNRIMLESHQSGMWTALPCIISSFNAVAITVECTPTIQGRKLGPDGKVTFNTMPKLVDVPVVFHHGGGYSMTFPIKPGDECLVVFASRCIDGWWQSGQISPPAEYRMHDLSDGFAIVGPYSQRTKIPNVSTNTAQFRSDDGTVLVELDHNGGVATVKAPNQIVLDSPLVHTTGRVIAAGDVVAGTVSLQQHRNTGVTQGTANTGPPLP